MDIKLREEGKTIILVSHNKEDIEILCDKVHEMDHGKLSYHILFPSKLHCPTMNFYEGK